MRSPKTTRIAICSSRQAAVSVAACLLAICAAELPAGAEPLPAGTRLLQVLPAGEFLPSDGRPMDSPAWRISSASAQRVIERVAARKKPPVIDYEHQTLNKEKNGQPAPAAAWIRGLRWIEGQGLFAVAELTARAARQVDEREYLYFSPVFSYDPQTGEVLDLFMGAFTNEPAIHGMQPLSQAAIAAATAAFLPPPEPPSMNPLLKALLAALGLPDTTTEDVAIAALTALGPLQPVVAQATAARTALGLTADANGDAVVAACTSLRTAAAPDPARFVPIALLSDAQSRIAALTAQLQTGTADAQIEAAMADGRLVAGPMETYAREVARTSGVAALTAFLSALQPIPALQGTQTQGQPPKVGQPGALTADQLAVCTAMGLTPEQFAKGA